MSLNKSRPILVLIILLLLLSCGLIVWGQSAQSEQVSKISLLIIDETKTFQQSMRIEVLAGNIQKMGIFDLSAEIADVESSYENPLKRKTADKKYDLILLFPKGLDDVSVQEVWLLSAPINHRMKSPVREGIETLSSMIERIFQVEAVDVSESLFPALLAGVLLRNGWISG